VGSGYGGGTWEVAAEVLSYSSVFCFTEVRFPTGHAWSGEPLAVRRFSASRSCLTIFGDAREGGTSYRTSRAISAAAWNVSEPSVARTSYSAYMDATRLVE
jgi:hypothetical protein